MVIIMNHHNKLISIFYFFFLLQFSCRVLTSEWHLQTGFTDSQSDSQFLTKPEIFTTSENSNINPKWMFCPVDLALPEAKWTLRYMYKRVTPAGSKFEFSWVVLSSLYFSWHQRSEFPYNQNRSQLWAVKKGKGSCKQ